jgi:hypothetical protein
MIDFKIIALDPFNIKYDTIRYAIDNNIVGLPVKNNEKKDINRQ